MGSRSVTCHPSQVNTLHLTDRQAGTRFIYPSGIEGWVDLGDWLHIEIVYPPADGHRSNYWPGSDRPGVELATRWSQVRRNTPPSHHEIGSSSKYRLLAWRLSSASCCNVVQGPGVRMMGPTRLFYKSSASDQLSDGRWLLLLQSLLNRSKNVTNS